MPLYLCSLGTVRIVNELGFDQLSFLGVGEIWVCSLYSVRSRAIMIV